MKPVMILALFASAAWCQMIHHPAPVPPSTFPIMAWGSAPSDAEQLKLMKEAGLNVAGFCRAEDASKIRDAGLTCFVSDKRVNGYDWSNMPPEDVLRKNVAEVVRETGKIPLFSATTFVTNRMRRLCRRWDVFRGYSRNWRRRSGLT